MNNFLTKISLKTGIQIERLKILQEIIIEKNFEIILEIDKIYLFEFNINDINNIKLFTDHNEYNIQSDIIFFYNKNYKININLNNKFKIAFKLYIIEDILRNEILNNQNNIFDYKINNGIFILENDNLISDELCDELINYIDNIKTNNIEKWNINTNVNCKYINISEINDNEIKNYFDTKLYKIFNWIIIYLKKEYNIQCSGDSGYILRKIFGPTRLHKDGLAIEIISNKYLPVKKIRNMSVIICLNDNYDGGEFYFPSQDFKIKLKKGQIIAFPPYWTHPHMVAEPINNTYRYTINTWLYE